jgi:hypothetical protein
MSKGFSLLCLSAQFSVIKCCLVILVRTGYLRRVSGEKLPAPSGILKEKGNTLLSLVSINLEVVQLSL